MVSIIVAMGRNRVIGKDNDLIWHLPADLKHFKETTMGKPVIMGRKTFESMGKPLPGRTNIVITRNNQYEAKGCLVAQSLEKALKRVSGEAEVFIAGGGEIYREAMPLADRMHITIIDHSFEGDTYFPEFSKKEWKIIEEIYHPANMENKYSMVLRTYERI